MTFIEGAGEDDPLGGRSVDWVYSRFLLMHVGDIRRALLAMANMLTDSGALLLEIADVGSLHFLPGTHESDVWRPWWYALGRSRGASYDVAERIAELLDQTGFAFTVATATSPWLPRRKLNSFTPWDSTSVHRRI